VNLDGLCRREEAPLTIYTSYHKTHLESKEEAM
jgi:hypothetical protein